MGEYTDHEIEMLARFDADRNADCPAWSSYSEAQKANARRWVRANLGCASGSDVTLDAAARLMREAREQGAAEMRERAARHLEVSHEGSWQGAREIRSLPLSVPK